MRVCRSFSLAKFAVSIFVLQVLDPEALVSANNNYNNKNNKRLKKASANYRHPCVKDEDCPFQLSCQFGYHGCQIGRCDCRRPFEKFVGGRCVKAKLGNSKCYEDDECPPDMTCDPMIRKCSCDGDQVMTSDGLYCLSGRKRTLGQSCEPDVDTCYHRIGDTYTSINVHCSRETRFCTCDAMMKDKFSCRSYIVDERGCEQIYDCEGGAICRGGRCRCPSTFKRWGNKCVRSNASLDVGFGKICDEINEISYCSQELVCVSCPSFLTNAVANDDDDDDDATGNKVPKFCLKPLITSLHLHSKSSKIELDSALFFSASIFHVVQIAKTMIRILQYNHYLVFR